MNGWRIIPNPPFADGLFSEQQTTAWELLKLHLPAGNVLTGTVYIQAEFGVFYDAGLGFPVLINVTEFGNPEGGVLFPDDYPALGSTISGKVWGFDESNRQIRVGRLPDFRVTYRLYTAEEGGRKTPAYQGIRWDFRYDDPAISTGTWMIRPVFLGLDGLPLSLVPLPHVGQADMYTLSGGLQAFHRQHIRPGVRGYFVEGSRRMGVCEVVEVIRLKQAN